MGQEQMSNDVPGRDVRTRSKRRRESRGAMRRQRDVLCEVMLSLRPISYIMLTKQSGTFMRQSGLSSLVVLFIGFFPDLNPV
ncbi:MAG: hypothetical protein NVS9B4_11380 [Candidatus Acidiferrum sp.]